MPISKQNTLSLRAPFAGQRSSAASRTLGPGECLSSLNVWTRDGTIDIRPPVLSYSAAHTYSTTPAWMLAIHPLYRGADVGYDILAVFVDTSRVYKAHLMTPGASGTGYSGWGTPTIRSCWRIGIASMSNVTFVMGGTAANSKKFYYSGGAWQTAAVGISTAPGAPSGFGTAAGGSLSATTTYSYRLTYYNSTTGTESGPGTAAEQATTGVNLTITFNLPGASGDSQVDKIRIYRKQVGTDDTWYLLDTVNDATASYTDDGNPSPTKTFAYEIPLYGFDITSEICVCAEYRGRMWYAPLDGTGSVVHSEFNKPETVNAANSYATSSDPGDLVNAIVPTPGGLYILKRNSIDVLTGDDPNSFAITRMATGVGCVAQASVVVIGERVYFANATGYWVIDGGRVMPVPISEPIRDVWMGITEHELISAARIPHSTCILLSFTQSASLSFSTTQPTIPGSNSEFRQFVYDYARNTWHEWDLSARSVGNMRAIGEGLENDLLVVEDNTIGGSDRYKFFYLAINTEDGDYGNTEIAWNWVTGDFDFLSQYDKSINWATVVWQNTSRAADPVDDNFSIDWYANLATSATGTKTLATDASPPREKVKVGVLHCDTIRFKLSGACQHRMRICGIDIEVETTGPR